MSKKNEVVENNATITTLDNDGNIDTQEVSTGEVTSGSGFDAMKAVQAAMDGEPSAFEAEIKLGLADRIQDAIERKRDDVAQAIFGPEDSEESSGDNDEETVDTDENKDDDE